MALTFDTKARFPTTASSTTTGNLTYGYTCGSSCGALVIFIIWSGTTNRTGGTPYYGAGTNTFTQVKTKISVTETSIEAWYILNPASGCQTVVVPNSGGRTAYMYMASGNSTSASIAYAFDSSGSNAITSAGPGVSVTTVSASTIIFAGIGEGANSWVPTGWTGTAIYDDDIGTWGGGAQYYVKSTSGCSTIGWTFTTSDDYNALAVAFSETTRNWSLLVGDSTQAQTSENVAITQHNLLILSNATQLQTAESTALSAHYSLTVNNATQTQTSDKFDLIQHRTLSVNDATQTQASMNFGTFTDGYGGDVQTYNDTYLSRLSPNSNYGSELNIILGGSSYSDDYNGLIKFDLSTLTGKTITGATLYLLCQSKPPYEDAVIAIARILPANNSWTELGATWNHQVGTTDWAGSAGCSQVGVDISTTAMGVFYPTTSDYDGLQYTISLDISEFTAMVSNNSGIILKGEILDPISIYSSDAGGSYAPKLVVLWTQINIPLTQHHSIAINNATHLDTPDNITITFHPLTFTLSVNNSSQLQTTTDSGTFTDGYGGDVQTYNDTYLSRTSPNTNYATTTSLYIGGTTYSDDYNTLIKFDLSSLVGKTITSASVYLTSSIPAQYEITTVTLNRILPANSSWTEDGATWNYALATTNRWAGDSGSNGGTDAGCSMADIDYSSTPSGSFDIYIGDYDVQYIIPIDTTELSTMVNNNYGFLIISTAADPMALYSSDTATTAYRPKLVVQWTQTNVFLTQNYSIAANDSTQLQYSDGAGIFNGPIIDNFNRATLGTNWTVAAGTPEMSGSVVYATTSGATSIRYSAATFNAPVEFFVTIGGLNIVVQNAYMDWMRNIADDHRYFIYLSNLTNVGAGITLYKYNGGNVNLISDAYAWSTRTSINIGIRHAANGDIKIYLNRGNGWEYILTTNDTTEISNGYANLRWYDVSVTPTCYFDNFGGGCISSVELTQHQVLVVNDAVQLQTSGNITLAQNYTLSVNNSTQTQTSENVILSAHYNLTVQDATQLQTSESVILTAHYSLTVQDSTQVQTSDNVTITYNSSTVTLSVNDATQAQRVNFYTFTDGFGGDVDTACDTSVFLNDFPTCNFGITTGLYYLLNDRKSLLRFDLSDIPFDATCVNATLTLKDESTAPTATLVVYSISVNNKEWIEGTKTFATAGAGEPCWNALAADGAGGVTTAWHGSAGLSTSGEDFEADAIGTFSVNGEPALTPFICSLDTNRISGWFGENNTNYGILLLTSDYSGFNGDFSSSDAATTSYRPKLVVQYIIPLALTQNYSLTVQDATQTQSTITSGTFTDGYEGDVFSAFDTFIGEYVGGEKSTDGYLVAGQLVSDDVKQTLMKFTLTSLEGKAITNAILTLYDAGGGNNTNGTYHIHRILPANAGWLEIATWQYADGAGASQYWAGDVGHDFGNDATCRVSGTDYATEIMSSLDLTNPAFSTKRDYILDITEFDNMVNANHGICIHGYDVNSTSWVFVSSDMPGNEMYYPKLIVTYIIPLTLTQNYSLVVQDATQAQTSNNITIIYHVGIIIDIDNEDNNISVYNYTHHPEFSSITSDAALAGTGLGLQVNASGSINPTVARYITAVNGNSIRYRFYFDVNNLNISYGSGTMIFATYTNGWASFRSFIKIYYSAGQWKYSIWGVGDDGFHQFSYSQTFTAEPHRIEVLELRGDNSSSNGSVTFWEDDILIGGQSYSLDNYDTWTDFYSFQMGLIEETDINTSGSIYFDEIIIRDDGKYIGPNIYTPTQNTTHAQTSDNISLTQNYSLSVDNATHLQTSDSIALTQNYSLTINDATQLQTSESVILTAHYSLTVQDSTQVQTSDNITITYNSGTVILTVQDSTQIQYCDGAIESYILDNFNRDNGSLGNNWTTMAGTDAPIISSGCVIVSQNSTLNSAYYTAMSFNNNQWASATFPSVHLGDTDYGPGVGVRFANSRGYILWYGNSANTVSLWIQTTSSNWSLLATSNTLTISPTDVWTITAIGSVITGYQNGNQVVQKTDSTYTDGNPGIWLYYNFESLDNFGAGGILTLTQTSSLTVQNATQIVKSDVSFGTFTDGDGGDVNTEKSVYVNENGPTTNYSSRDRLNTNGNSPYRIYSLVGFTLTSLIGKIITSATMHLYQYGYHDWGSNGVSYLNRILPENSSWTKVGATWNHAVENTVEWAGGENGCGISGTDYSATTMGSLNFNIDNPLGYEYSIPLNLDEFNLMLINNAGIIISTEVNTFSMVVWSTVDNAEYGPKLVVEYLVPLTLTQNYSLSVDNATHLQTSDSIALTQNYSLTINDATHLQTSDSIALTQNYSLTIDDSTQLQIGGGSGIALVGAVSSYSSSLEKQVTSGNVLIFVGFVTDGNTPISSGTASITSWVEVEHQTLAGYQIYMYWAQVISSGSLTVTCAGDDQSLSLHEYTGINTSNPIDKHNTATKGASGSSISVSLTGVSNGAVIVAGVDEEYTPLTLTATPPFTRRTFEINACSATSDYVVPSAGDYTAEFTENGTAPMSMIASSFLADAFISLTQHHLLVINDTTQIQTADNINLTFYPPAGTLSVQDATQVQTSENVVLSAHYSLVVNNSTQTQIVDGNVLTFTEIEDIVLIVHYSLVINNITQAQTSDNIALIQHQVLIVSDTTQLQTSDKITIIPRYGIIVDINHEDGTLNEYTSTTDPDADLSVTSSAAMGGTSLGLQVNIDDLNLCYGKYTLNISSVTGELRSRFYVNANSLTMASYDEFTLCYFGNSDNNGLAFISLQRVGATYNIRGWMFIDSGGGEVGTAYTITGNEQHVVEIYLKRATTDVSGNGSLDIYVDDILRASISNKDNYDRFFNFKYVNFGNCGIVDAGTSGIFYLDELVVRDDNVKIGALFESKNSTQSQTSENITLTQHQVLIVNDTIQIQTSDNIALTQHQILVIGDATQTQTSTTITLIYQGYYNLILDNAIHGQTSENISLTQHQILTVNDASQIQTSENTVLSAHYTITINDTTQLQKADGATCTDSAILDDFNRANGNPGANWTIISGTPTISSNRIQGDKVSLDKLFWNVDSFSNDQYTEAKQYVPNSTGISWRGVVVRASGSVPENYYGYVAYLDGTNSSPNTRWLRIGWHMGTTGWGQYLDSVGVGVVCEEGSILRLEVTGQSPNIVLKAYINGTLVKKLTQAEFANPLAVLNSGKAGLYIHNNTPTSQMDDFAAGNLNIINLSAHYSLTINDATQLQTSENVVLTQHQILVINNSTQLQNSDNTILTQHQLLNVNDSVQLQTSDDIILTQHQILVVNDATQLQTSENVILIQHQVLAINDSTQLQTSDSIVLTQHQVLVVNDSTQIQTTSSLTLNYQGHYTLVINDATQAHTAQNTTLTALVPHYVLYIIGSYESLLLEDAGYLLLEDGSKLALEDSIARIILLQTVDNVVITAHYALTNVDNSTQAQTSDNITLTQHQVLVVQDATQTQTSENIILLAHYNITINNSTQLQTSENTILTQYQILAINDASQVQTSDDINLTQHHILVVDNASQNQTVNNITLIYQGYYNLILNDSVHNQTSENISLTQHQILSIDNVIQIQTSENISLKQNYKLNNIVFDIDLETGDFSQFTSVSNPHGDLSVSKNAALGGTVYGLSVTVNDITGDYGYIVLTKNCDNIKFRAYIDINNISIPNSQYFYISDFQQNGSPYWHIIDWVLSNIGGSIWIRANITDDSNSIIYSASSIISSGVHVIDNYITRATGSATSNGTYELWIDGISKGSKSGIDNYNIIGDSSQRLTLGNFWAFSGDITGTIYLDEFVANNTGEPIGDIGLKSFIKITSENVVLTQHQILIVNDTIQLQTSENIGLIQHQVLIINDVIQLQTSDNTELIQHQILAIGDCIQLQTSDNIILIQHQILEIIDVVQLQTSENVILSAHYTIVVNDSAHTQISDNITLTQHHILSIDDTTQLQTSDNIILTQHHVLIINDTTQNQTSSTITLIYQGYYNLILDNTIHAQTSENIYLTQHQILSIDNIIQVQTSDNIDLIQNQVLAIQDTTQVQIADNVSLVQHHVLVVNNSIQIHLVNYYRFIDGYGGDTTTSIDTFIDSSTPTTNYGGGTNISTAKSSRTANGLIKFSILENIPLNADIISATLNLYCAAVYEYANPVISIYRQKRAWTEYGATWNKYDGTNDWQISGGFGIDDCEQTEICNYIFDNNPVSTHVYFSLISSTVTDLDLGNGWLIRASSGDFDCRWRSSGTPNNDEHPLLTVEYIIPLILAQHQILIVEDTTQFQTSNDVNLNAHYSLTVENSTQLQTSDNVTITYTPGVFVLLVQDSTQVQTVDNIILTQHQVLEIQNTVQIQTGGNVDLTQHMYGALIVQDATQLQSSDNISLTQHHILIVDNSSQSQNSENVTLTAHYTISVENSIQLQNSENILLTQHYVLVINDSVQLQAAENTVLTQHMYGVLTIENATQLQTADNITLTAYVPTFLLTANLTLSNAGLGSVNGYYIDSGKLNSKEYYVLSTDNDIRVWWNGSIWVVGKYSTTTTYYYSTDNVVTPDLITSWIVFLPGGGIAPAPTVYSHFNVIQTQTSENVTLTAHVPVYSLSVNNATQIQTSDNTLLTQHYLLFVNDISQLQTSDNIALFSHYAILVNDVIQTHAANNVELFAHYSLIVNNITQLQTSDKVSLTQNYLLSVNNASQLQVSDTIILLAHYSIAVNNATQTQTSDNIGLIQHYILSVQNTTQLQTAESVTLVTHMFGILNVLSSTQGQTSESVSLTQHHILATNDATQLQISDNATVIPRFAITVNNSAHNQTTEQVILTAHYGIAINNATQIQTCDNITLTQHHILTINNTIHYQTANNVILLAHYTITINDSTHAQTCGGVILTAHYNAIANNATHLQTSDNIELTQHHILAVNDTVQIITSDVLIFFAHYAITTDDSTQVQTADGVVLIFHNMLEVENCIHLQSSDEIVLFAHYAIITDNTVHGQTTSEIIFITVAILVRDCIHIQTSDNIKLIYFHVLATPDSRTFTIGAERRVYVVIAEDRFYFIPPWIDDYYRESGGG